MVGHYYSRSSVPVALINPTDIGNLTAEVKEVVDDASNVNI